MRPGPRRTAVCFLCRFARSSIAPYGRSNYFPSVAPSLEHRVSPFRLFSSYAALQRGKARTKSRDTSGKGRPDRDSSPLTKLPKKLEAQFVRTLESDLKTIKDKLRRTPFAAHLERESLGFANVWTRLEESLSSDDPDLLDKDLVRSLQDHFIKTEGGHMLDQLTYAFYELATNDSFSDKDLQNQRALTDLRYPNEWYPRTREIQRTVHVHVGPTNSGKTYHALKRLESVENGNYAGPLRLLANEIYTRLNDAGKPCLLVTGDEMRAPPEHLITPNRSIDLASCTVEMMPINKQTEVAVIDEIQMLASIDRGWAWTQALLGVAAKEVHVCGEPRTVPLIRSLCASVGDKLVLHEYKRLSPLAMDKRSLNGDLSNLVPGDCVVCFSVVAIHAMRKRIEQRTKRKVAIVYGSLPPETRAHQARLFNDPDNEYDYLVASDAIGMGLNLAIKRVVFETTFKFDGVKLNALAVPDVKQIAGRAGRYSVPDALSKKAAEASPSPPPADEDPPSEGEKAQDMLDGILERLGEREDTNGLVTTVEKFDYPFIRKAMESEPEPIETAGLLPPREIVERFARYYPPSTPLSFILQRLSKMARTGSQFHLCTFRDQSWIADAIQDVEGLTIADKNIFIGCPASRTDGPLYTPLLQKLAQCVAQQQESTVTDILEIPLEYLTLELEANRGTLRKLELLHKAITTYLWLSYRFVGIFSDRKVAFHVKEQVQAKINTVLESLDTSAQEEEKIRKKRERRAMRLMEEEEKRQTEANRVDETEMALDDHEDVDDNGDEDQDNDEDQDEDEDEDEDGDEEENENGDDGDDADETHEAPDKPTDPGTPDGGNTPDSK